MTNKITGKERVVYTPGSAGKRRAFPRFDWFSNVDIPTALSLKEKKNIYTTVSKCISKSYYEKSSYNKQGTFSDIILEINAFAVYRCIVY